MARKHSSESKEIIVEFTVMGHLMRVTAMDSESLTEVVIQGPLNADRNNLASLATQKLNFVMAKNRRNGRL
ncbi:MAG: DUF6898 family protein [Geminicoccales bacterium]